MSYCIEISDSLVTFKSEKDYLNCRIEYLICSEESGENTYWSFFGFINEDAYDKSICEIESIRPKHSSEQEESPPDEPVDESVDEPVLDMSWHHISADTEGVYVDGNIVASTTTAPLEISNTSNMVWSTNVANIYNEMPAIGYRHEDTDFDEDWVDLACGIIRQQIKKEEEIGNDNPIEDRSEIIDL